MSSHCPLTFDVFFRANLIFVRPHFSFNATGESLVLDVHTNLNGTANVYTLDYRGTGRSTLLDCVAAQALTTGSPSSRDVDPTEIAAYAKALEIEYNDLAVFSITSTATDLATLISKYTNGASTIVYGASYGSTLATRLMHMNPPEVAGYVLDGIASVPGAPAGKFEYLSTYETDFGEVGDHFLNLCALDSACSTHFSKKSLSDTLEDLLVQFDKDPSSTCAALVSNKTSSWSSVKASFQLRETLGTMLNSEVERTMIPPVVYRLNRCLSEDVEVMSNFTTLSTLSPALVERATRTRRSCCTSLSCSPSYGSCRDRRWLK